MGGNADDTEYDTENGDFENGDSEDGVAEVEEVYGAGDEETVPRPPATPTDTDVFLDVPLLKVDEIDLDVEDLRAHVSLQAEVLDLLRLSVGADVSSAACTWASPGWRPRPSSGCASTTWP